MQDAPDRNSISTANTLFGSRPGVDARQELRAGSVTNPDPCVQVPAAMDATSPVSTSNPTTDPVVEEPRAPVEGWRDAESCERLVAQFERDGYCVVEGALDAAHVARLTALLEAMRPGLEASPHRKKVPDSTHATLPRSTHPTQSRSTHAALFVQPTQPYPIQLMQYYPSALMQPYLTQLNSINPFVHSTYTSTHFVQKKAFAPDSPYSAAQSTATPYIQPASWFNGKAAPTEHRYKWSTHRTSVYVQHPYSLASTDNIAGGRV